MTGNAAWLFITAAYGVGVLLLALEVIFLVRRSRGLRGPRDEA